MLHLLRTELSYRRNEILSCACLLLGAMILVTLRTDDGQSGVEEARLVLFGSGFILVMWLYVRDIHERRQLTWLPLPLETWKIAAVRLSIPWILQIGMTALAIGLFLGLRAALSLEISSRVALLEFLTVQGTVLAVVATVALNEETSVLLHRSKIGLTLVGLLATATLVVILIWAQGLSDRPSLVLPLVSHGIAVVWGLLAGGLFVRRTSYLIGISPIHGYPEDWSQATSGRR